MPHGTGIGVYPYGEVGSALENDEVSSTYEGRHLTVTADQITSHDPAHALQQKGHPLVVGENIVGVAFKTEVLGTDLIAFDTEGIWLLSVVATDDLGNVAVVAGDELFINKTTAIISKNNNKNTHAHFGYALGGVVLGQTAIISVKVHWDPDDATEKVGAAAALFVSDRASQIFRQYHYDAGGGGLIEGERMTLTPTAPCATACVDYRKLILAGTANMVTGRASVIEARLEITAGDVRQDTMSVACFDWSCLCTDGLNNWVNAYVLLRDRTHATVGQIRSLLHFYDHAALPDGGAVTGVLTDALTDRASDVRVACSYGPALTMFWLLGTTIAPD